MKDNKINTELHSVTLPANDYLKMVKALEESEQLHKNIESIREETIKHSSDTIIFLSEYIDNILKNHPTSNFDIEGYAIRKGIRLNRVTIGQSDSPIIMIDKLNKS